MKKEREKLWNTLSLETKILLAVTLMILTLFASNVFIYLQTNKLRFGWTRPMPAMWT